MKWERTIHRSCVDSALHVLEQLLDGGDLLKYPPDLRNGIKRIYRDLKFFKMFIWGLAYQEQLSQDLVTMMLDFRQTSELYRKQFEGATYAESMEKWVPVSHILRGKIEQYMPLSEQICALVLGGVLPIKNSKLEELFIEYGAGTVSFIELILDNLGILSSNIGLNMRPIKREFAILEGISKVSGKFVIHLSCLACLHWLQEMNCGSSYSMGSSSLFDVMQKYRPYTLGILTFYLRVLCEANEYDKVQMEVIHQYAVSYIDFLLGHFFIASKDDIESLHKGLIFLFSFVLDPWKEPSHENQFLLVEIYAIISEVPSIFCSLETELSDYLQKLNRVRRHVEKLYVIRPLSSELHSPKTDVIGFLNSFLANLEKMLKGKVGLIPFIRDEIIKLHIELVSLQPFLGVHLQLESEHEHLWTQIVNLTYFAAYIIKLCPTTCFREWYVILFLPSLIKDIKLVKSEVIKKINLGQIQMYAHKRLTFEVEKSSSAPEATTSKKEGAFIGYEQDADEIINHLVRGTRDLRIVSISGMAGQGKTTLAKRIYNHPSTVYHFHKKVWCYVSKECKIKKLLVKIVGGVDKPGDSIHDAADCVRKSLKGNRYLIVLDDIWDVDSWKVMQGAFPNDKIGSRILFTTRNHDLASQAQMNSISHRLRPLSDNESRELMKVELSICDSFPPAFFRIAEQIAHLCKGLPLAIALIAPVLRRAGPTLGLWKQVTQNLNSYLAGEGCMDIVELSFTYLPHHLKPCFLYFIAFPRSIDICARKLKLLWCAEGFVKGNEMQKAGEYLDDLVSKNLVIVTRRSSIGLIKKCRICHDLLYDLCLDKAVQYNFLHVASQSIITGIHKRYEILRLSTDNAYVHFNDFVLPKPSSGSSKLPGNQIHTVLYNPFYQVKTDLWSYFLRNFRALTILDFENLCLCMFPKEILYNIHLRYLALWGTFEDIPASIVDLWNLETFILKSECDTVRTPVALWEIEGLKYVDIETFSLHQKDLLQNKSSMCNRNVEVLKGITLKYGLTSEVFVGRFVRLKKLKCWCEDNEGDFHTKWFSMFRSLENLESLTLCCPFTFSYSHVYQQLPITLNFPKNLKKLNLIGEFGLPWSAMSTIGKLSNLRVLLLRDESCVGTTWHLRDDEFSNLTCLELHRMEVEQIDDSGCEDTPFPCLKKLLLFGCWNLKEIPASFGDILTLDTIDVSCSANVSDSVRRIVEQQHDMGNDHLQVTGLKRST